MKIRSITYFFNPGFPLDNTKLRTADDFLRTARIAYQDAGYEVQTTRLATPSFTLILDGAIDKTPTLAHQLASSMEIMDAGYASLGPALPEFPQSPSKALSNVWNSFSAEDEENDDPNDNQFCGTKAKHGVLLPL